MRPLVCSAVATHTQHIRGGQRSTRRCLSGHRIGSGKAAISRWTAENRCAVSGDRTEPAGRSCDFPPTFHNSTRDVIRIPGTFSRLQGRMKFFEPIARPRKWLGLCARGTQNTLSDRVVTLGGALNQTDGAEPASLVRALARAVFDGRAKELVIGPAAPHRPGGAPQRVAAVYAAEGLPCSPPRTGYQPALRRRDKPRPASAMPTRARPAGSGT